MSRIAEYIKSLDMIRQAASTDYSVDTYVYIFKAKTPQAPRDAQKIIDEISMYLSYLNTGYAIKDEDIKLVKGAFKSTLTDLRAAMKNIINAHKDVAIETTTKQALTDTYNKFNTFLTNYKGLSSDVVLQTVSMLTEVYNVLHTILDDAHNPGWEALQMLQQLKGTFNEDIKAGIYVDSLERLQRQLIAGSLGYQEGLKAFKDLRDNLEGDIGYIPQVLLIAAPKAGLTPEDAVSSYESVLPSWKTKAAAEKSQHQLQYLAGVSSIEGYTSEEKRFSKLHPGRAGKGRINPNDAAENYKEIAAKVASIPLKDSVKQEIAEVVNNTIGLLLSLAPSKKDDLAELHKIKLEEKHREKHTAR